MICLGCVTNPVRVHHANHGTTLPSTKYIINSLTCVGDEGVLIEEDGGIFTVCSITLFICNGIIKTC